MVSRVEHVTAGGHVFVISGFLKMLPLSLRWCSTQQQQKVFPHQNEKKSVVNADVLWPGFINHLRAQKEV